MYFKRSRLRSLAVVVLAGIVCLPLSATLFSRSGLLIAEASDSVNNWWPVDGATVNGVQPFKAMVEGKDVSQYSMTWQVDGGTQNNMSDDQADYPHKEASVDVSGWNWRGSGPYEITFTAKENGNVIGSKSIKISVAEPKSEPSVEKTVTPEPEVNEQEEIAEPEVEKQIETQIETQTATEPLNISVWWPTSGAVVQGTQPLKAEIPNMKITDYEMYWKIGDGKPTPLKNNYNDGPHKEADIDFSSWTWNGAGPYVIDLLAKDDGLVVAQKQISVTTTKTSQQQPVQQQPVQQQAIQSVEQLVTQTSSSFYVDPNSTAARQVVQWQSSRPSDAEQIKKIANSPVAKWFGDWNGGNIYNDVKGYVDAASNVGKTPVMILYNVPGRDCGSYSAGGSSGSSAYASWIGSVSQAIGNRKALVVLEPDSLAQMDCLSASDQQTRMNMLSSAVKTLKGNSGTTVYMDAGHPFWQSVSTMADRLTRAGVAQADGFSLNVSNFIAVADNVRYGDELGKKIGKHYVVDTSRNGLGSNSEWCNPSGRALGMQPTRNTGNALADAFLWLKAPGESDGNCNGGPNAGVWWSDYALGLAKRAAF